MTKADGYARALDLLRACATDAGFIATPVDEANYSRVWARDGIVMGLAALKTREDLLCDALRRTFETLVENQGPHGEVPSNVDARTGRVSYGGTTGRVDADLWFLIGCGEYWTVTRDDAFMQRMLPAMRRVGFLLGAWEFNNRGLLYVPQTGDWADEYIHSGYVLYDQLLYYQALRALVAVQAGVEGERDEASAGRIRRLHALIRANYWFEDEEQEAPEGVYHEVLYEKGRDALPHCSGRYWMAFFAPTGYGYRFDAFANVLTSLLGISGERERSAVDAFIAEIVNTELPLLPAFHPVIEPQHEAWEDLQVTFSYEFKNRPHEFHNGGLWPLITGFYSADLAQRGRREEAERFLDAVHRANALEMEGEPWSFPEYVHGRKLTAGGMRRQGWSAAAAVIAHHALRGEAVLELRLDDD